MFIEQFYYKEAPSVDEAIDPKKPLHMSGKLKVKILPTKEAQGIWLIGFDIFYARQNYLMESDSPILKGHYVMVNLSRGTESPLKEL